MRKTTTLRRASAALVLAVGVLAVTGTGAGAAVVTPAILDGFANSQALKIKLVVPAIDDLKGRLAAAGIPVAAVPNTNVAGVTLEQAISVNSGNARKQGSTASASGFAAAGIGALINRSARTSCSTSSCPNGESTAALPKTTLLGQVADGGIGSIEVAAADSLTSTFLDTKNRTGFVEVDLDASKLLGPGGTLAAVGGALTTLANTVNTAVLPTVNPVIKNFTDTVNGLDAIKPVRDELSRYATIGEIKPLPDPAATKLLSLDVLASEANVVREARNNTTGLLATASSKIADLSVLGGWVSVDSAALTSSAYANGIKAAAEATSNAKIVGATLGGLLNVDISEADLARLTNPETLKGVLRGTAPAGFETQVEDVAAAIDLVNSIAGVTVEFLSDSKTALPNGRFAKAEAGTLRITVAPKIPILANGVTPAGSAVPRLAADDYVSTGLSLQIDLPTTEVQVSAGEVLCVGRCANRTGVGTAWGAILLLFAAAFTVKRFGLGTN